MSQAENDRISIRVINDILDQAENGDLDKRDAYHMILGVMLSQGERGEHEKA